MSDDQREMHDEELDKISGGVFSHPIPRDPIKPGQPPTHPGGAQLPIHRPSNPVG